MRLRKTLMSLEKFNSARDPSDHISKAAHAAHRGNARAQAQNTPGSLLPTLARPASGIVQQNELLRGNWIGRNAQDMQEDDKWQAFAAAPEELGWKTLPFEEYTRYVQGKRVRQEFQNNLILASLLIDPSRPETQVNAYAVMPQLKIVTDEDFRRELQTQIYLRHIVLNGHISTQEELEFIGHMLHPQFVLPKNALWDLTGAIMGDATNSESTANRDAGLFMHYLWAPDVKADNYNAAYPGLEGKQVTAKAKIIQRCLPALRDRAIGIAEKFVVDYAKGVLKGKIVGVESTAGWKDNAMSYPFPTDYNSKTIAAQKLKVEAQNPDNNDV